MKKGGKLVNYAGKEWQESHLDFGVTFRSCQWVSHLPGEVGPTGFVNMPSYHIHTYPSMLPNSTFASFISIIIIIIIHELTSMNQWWWSIHYSQFIIRILSSQSQEKTWMFTSKKEIWMSKFINQRCYYISYLNVFIIKSVLIFFKKTYFFNDNFSNRIF